MNKERMRELMNYTDMNRHWTLSKLNVHAKCKQGKCIAKDAYDALVISLALFVDDIDSYYRTISATKGGE